MKDITLCHPKLQLLAAKMIEECEKQGLKIKIGETFRTAAEQEELYAQGRTKPGSIVTNAKGSSYSSQHQWGIAFDFYRNDGKGAYNEEGQFFIKVGKAAKAVGLGWGGDWTSIVDKPHVYLTDWGSTPKKLKELYKTPEAFMKTWETEEPTEPCEGFVKASDKVRWSYQFKNGAYAKSGWYWLTEATSGTSGWYLFDEDDLMLTGYQKDKTGAPFFLCPDQGIHEGKCMVTDPRGVLKIVEKYDFKNKQYMV